MSDSDLLHQVGALPALPPKSSPVEPGHYAIKCVDGQELEAVDEKIQAKVWFKSSPLSLDAIRRLESIQLLTESHDQGTADEPDAGNWTWFELVILENESATVPRVKDGIELVWPSHENVFLKSDFEASKGATFGKQHDLMRQLEDGNVLGVRICARFAGWRITAKIGYLAIDIGKDPLVRSVVDYSPVVNEVVNIEKAITQVNEAQQAAFAISVPQELFRAGAFSKGEDRPLRVLALDGGGVRGYSSLLILKEVMKGFPPGTKPCEVFDMIGGTSTGGLIAIMLGRLKLTVDKCLDIYDDIMPKIFWNWKNLHFAAKKTFHDAKDLENVVRGLVFNETGNGNLKLLSDDPNDCKVFCLAVRRDAANNRAPVFLRTYTNPLEKSLLPDIEIWQAARATSAAPAYFAPIKVGDYELIDGGLGANNPLGWLWSEVLSVFGATRTTDCFLSIGTGIDSNQELVDPGLFGSHEVEKRFANIATNSEIVHILFRTLIDAYAPKPLSKKYWRLNVSEAIPEWDETKKTWSWPKFWKTEITVQKHLDNYKGVGELDDLEALKQFKEMTHNWIQSSGKALIEEASKALTQNL